MDAPLCRSDIAFALDIVFWRRDPAAHQMCSRRPSSARVGHEQAMAKAGMVICRARTSLFANPAFPALFRARADRWAARPVQKRDRSECADPGACGCEGD